MFLRLQLFDRLHLFDSLEYKNVQNWGKNKENGKRPYLFLNRIGRRGAKTSFTVSITAANWNTAWYAALTITCTFCARLTLFIAFTLAIIITLASYTIFIIFTVIFRCTYLKFRFTVVIEGVLSALRRQFYPWREFLFV